MPAAGRHLLPDWPHVGRRPCLISSSGSIGPLAAEGWLWRGGQRRPSLVWYGPSPGLVVPSPPPTAGGPGGGPEEALGLEPPPEVFVRCALVFSENFYLMEKE